MSGTVVWFDRTVDDTTFEQLRDFDRIVLVRCRVTGEKFRVLDDVVAVDCEFVQFSFYWGIFMDCAFVQSRFTDGDLSADFFRTHFHACRFTNCGISMYGTGGEPEFRDVHFTDCLFVNTGAPRVVRGRADGGGSLCTKIESAEHRLARVDYVMRHTHDRDLDVVGPISFGVPLRDHAVHAERVYTDSELCKRDLAPGWPVLVGCAFAGVTIGELGNTPVFVGCTWRQVVVSAYVFDAVFVECEFVEVEWRLSFANTRFLRCTFRQCRFPEDLGDAGWPPGEDDFEVTFDDCVFERCEPPTPR